MKPFKTYAYIQSLNKDEICATKLDEVEMIDKLSCGQFKVKYKGKLCTAIFNNINYRFYVDDVYGILKEQN